MGALVTAVRALHRCAEYSADMHGNISIYICAQWLGPRRITPNPLDISHPQLPRLDFVVISHNHYDHLDSGTVARLNKRFGTDLTW